MLWEDPKQNYLSHSLCIVHAIGLSVRSPWVTSNRKCKLNLLKQLEFNGLQIKGCTSAFRDSLTQSSKGSERVVLTFSIPQIYFPGDSVCIILASPPPGQQDGWRLWRTPLPLEIPTFLPEISFPLEALYVPPCSIYVHNSILCLSRPDSPAPAWSPRMEVSNPHLRSTRESVGRWV